MEEIFSPVLDKDEKVLKVFKPNKAKMFWSMFLRGLFTVVWVCLFFAFGFGIGLGKDVVENGETVTYLNNNAFYIALACSFVVCMLLIVLFYHLAYKHTFYSYTNKRILIRKGIIGVDYKSLDMGMIGAVSVNVSLLDKLVHKNTGTIVFGSMASPMVARDSMMFKFAHLKEPYETYKEIKNEIDDFKKEKESNKK